MNPKRFIKRQTERGQALIALILGVIFLILIVLALIWFITLLISSTITFVRNIRDTPTPPIIETAVQPIQTLEPSISPTEIPTLKPPTPTQDMPTVELTETQATPDLDTSVDPDETPPPSPPGLWERIVEFFQSITDIFTNK